MLYNENYKNEEKKLYAVDKGETMKQEEWERLSPTQKKEQLYFRQVHMLQLFRDRHAISEEDYNKSVHDLTLKMCMENQAVLL